jgi:hypothetical protein
MGTGYRCPWQSWLINKSRTASQKWQHHKNQKDQKQTSLLHRGPPFSMSQGFSLTPMVAKASSVVSCSDSCFQLVSQ